MIKNQFLKQDFLDGTTLLVNKPLEWTSFDVVNKLRFQIKHTLKVKKIKVGHAGTLDPLATGLLIICTGKSTRLLNEFQGLDKVYTGVITLGATTPSYDKETTIDQTFPTDHITSDLIEENRKAFIGAQKQYPPMFSAVKVDGERLYKKARSGESVEIEPRDIVIHDFCFPKIDLPDLHFEVHCGKGTYIRSLAYDFGNALQSGAYLSALCRTKIGSFSLEQAWELEDLLTAIQSSI